MGVGRVGVWVRGCVGVGVWCDCVRLCVPYWFACLFVPHPSDGVVTWRSRPKFLHGPNTQGCLSAGNSGFWISRLKSKGNLSRHQGKSKGETKEN